MDIHHIKFTQAEEGKVSQLNAIQGDFVLKGQPLCTITEENIECLFKSPVKGKVHKIYVSYNQLIKKDDVILEIDTSAKPKIISDLAYFDVEDINDPEIYDFGEDAILSDEEFVKKYSRKLNDDGVYKENELTLALLKQLIIHKCDFSIQGGRSSHLDLMHWIEKIINKCGYSCGIFYYQVKGCTPPPMIKVNGVEDILVSYYEQHNPQRYDCDFQIVREAGSCHIEITYTGKHKKHSTVEQENIKKEISTLDIDTSINPEKEVGLAEIQEGLKQLKEGLAELEAAPREMHKALFDFNNISNDEEYDFGEDANLSNKLFAEKYGNKTYRPNEITPALLKELILHKCNFSIKTKNISEAVDKVEAIIEKCGYKCRVYTENRSSALATAAIPGFGLLAGAAAAIGIAAHNLATYDPDFEIGKNFFDDKVNVTYKK